MDSRSILITGGTLLAAGVVALVLWLRRRSRRRARRLRNAFAVRLDRQEILDALQRVARDPSTNVVASRPLAGGLVVTLGQRIAPGVHEGADEASLRAQGLTFDAALASSLDALDDSASRARLWGPETVHGLPFCGLEVPDEDVGEVFASSYVFSAAARARAAAAMPGDLAVFLPGRDVLVFTPLADARPETLHDVGHALFENAAPQLLAGPLVWKPDGSLEVLPRPE